ncbi:MAG: endonuclease MutS2, partial [Acidobacteria bacterium]
FLKSPFTRLDALAGGTADVRDLVRELEGKILPEGTVGSSASPALARIRRSIERLKVEVQSALEKLLRRLSQAGVLQDTVIAIRNERFVLPIRAEEKHRVHGIVHGASSSGATLYLEPMETVPL